MDNTFQGPEASSKDLFPDTVSDSSHNALAGDIEKLGQQIQEKKSSPESQSVTDKDLIKQHLQPMVYPQGRQAAPVVPAPAAQDEDKYLPDYLKDAPQETKIQVEKLLEETIKSGLAKGISDAQKMPPFVLDAYHDALIDKLHDELKKRKII